MVPILYESTETTFANNGLCRLRDMTECLVTEERNGVYEIDFKYPVTGRNYSEIKPGRIIAVTHEDGGDIQPFDIVSYQREIDGIVSFHGVHISYRLLGVITSGASINSLTDALAMLRNGSPDNNFTYSANFESANYMAAADGVPRSVRQMIGGVEGSILDTYGGELKFDKFSVELLAARGDFKNVTIRYGLNLTGYTEDADYLSTYTSVVPYWKGQGSNGVELVVKGSRVDSGLTSYNGRNNCAAIDLTDKFENQPTAANLESLAASMLASDSPNMPDRSIEVKYIDLRNFGEYETIANLINCKLCDSVNVVFPMYGISGRFKIVKTVYNVLQDRFEELELGKLSTTLAEALGITQDGALKASDLDLPGYSEIRITSYGSGWAQYADGGANEIWCRKYGRMVTVTGIMRNSAAKTINTTEQTMFTVPAGYRPQQLASAICQGTDTAVWMFRVNTGGTATASRYRLHTNSYPSVAVGSWFPFHIAYIAAE